MQILGSNSPLCCRMLAATIARNGRLRMACEDGVMSNRWRRRGDECFADDGRTAQRFDNVRRCKMQLSATLGVHAARRLVPAVARHVGDVSASVEG